VRAPACLEAGLVAGVAGGLLGGLPSTVALSIDDLDRSVRAIAHLIPGNSRLRSLWSRRVAGAAVHMGLSVSFGVLYSCGTRRRLDNPSLAAAMAYGAALWAVNIKLLAPKALLEEDRSLTFADHLCYGVVLELSLRKVAEKRPDGRQRLG
jgi:hypothetical protein